MTIYYKAVRPDGTDFFTGKIVWDRPGQIVRHPHTKRGEAVDGPKDALCVSTVVTDCAGMRWPARCLTVEPVRGYKIYNIDPLLPHKRMSVAWRVVKELPGHVLLGPQGAAAAAFIERAATLSTADCADIANAALGAAWKAARLAAREAAREAARKASREASRAAAREVAGDVAREAARKVVRKVVCDAVCDAVWDAAGDAALALVVADLIDKADYDTLTAPCWVIPGLVPDWEEVRT